MSVHPNNYHQQDGYSAYNSYYYYGHPPAQNPPHQSHHHHSATVYDESYTNPTYWAEEDDVSSYSSSCQSGGSPGELTPTPSTCSAKDIYDDSPRSFSSSSITLLENKILDRPATVIPIPMRKKGVGGRRKNEKPPSPTVVKKRRLAANAR